MQLIRTAGELQAGIAGGAFMVTGRNWPNIMTVGWGSYGVMWNKHIVMIPVRRSKFTHEIVQKYNEFSICLPPPHLDMRAQLNFCATRSGRDFDKFKECGFTALPAQTINSYVIKESGLVYECKVVYKADLDLSGLSKTVYDLNYKTNDLHTFFYGEILKEYRMMYDQRTTMIIPPGSPGYY